MQTADERMKEIAQRIKSRREQLGYSYQQLADATGMSKSTLQRYENGSIKNIPLGRLKDLADALHTSADYLMGWSNDDFIGDPVAKISSRALKTLKKLDDFIDVEKPLNVEAAAALYHEDTATIPIEHKSRVEQLQEIFFEIMTLPQEDRTAINSCITKGIRAPALDTLNNLASDYELDINSLLKIDTEKVCGASVPKLSDTDIKFALFGESDDISDEMLEEVKAYANFVKYQHQNRG